MFVATNMMKPFCFWVTLSTEFKGLGEREKVWLSKYHYAGQKRRIKEKETVLKKYDKGNIEKKRIEKAKV